MNFVGAALAAALLVALHATAADIDKQRELFKDVYETVERGDWSPVDGLSASDQQLLQQYVLWPDLRATWLRANLGERSRPQRSTHSCSCTARCGPYVTFGTGRRCSSQKQATSPVTRRSTNSSTRAKDIARLDCLSLQAEIKAGDTSGSISVRSTCGSSARARSTNATRYLITCANNNLLGPAEYRQRFDLAITAREFQLARWLAKKIDQRHVDEAALWIGAQSNPEEFLSQPSPP